MSLQSYSVNYTHALRPHRAPRDKSLLTINWTPYTNQRLEWRDNESKLTLHVPRINH